MSKPLLIALAFLSLFSLVLAGNIALSHSDGVNSGTYCGCGGCGSGTDDYLWKSTFTIPGWAAGKTHVVVSSGTQECTDEGGGLANYRKVYKCTTSACSSITEKSSQTGGTTGGCGSSLSWGSSWDYTIDAGEGTGEQTWGFGYRLNVCNTWGTSSDTSITSVYAVNTVPSAPADIKPGGAASESYYIGNSINVNWTASTDPDVGQTITYTVKLYNSTSSTALSTICSTTSTNCNWDIESVAPYSAYKIQITPNDGYEDGSVGYSSEAFALAYAFPAVSNQAPVNNSDSKEGSVSFIALGVLNASSDAASFVNATLWVFYSNGTLMATQANTTSVTNASNLTISTTVFANSNAYWQVEFCDDNNACKNTTAFYIDFFANPTVALRCPKTAASYTLSNVTFQFKPRQFGPAFGNATLYLWHSNGSIYSQLNQSGLLNDTRFNNITRIVPDGVYSWNVEVCNNLSGCASAASNYTLTIDVTPPTYGSITTNGSDGTGVTNHHEVGSNVTFNVNWTEVTTSLDDYIFSWTNNGSWVNDSAVSFSGSWSNITKNSVNNSPQTISWRLYANNSLGLMNDTGVQSITLVNTTVKANLSSGIAAFNVSRCFWGSPTRYCEPLNQTNATGVFNITNTGSEALNITARVNTTNSNATVCLGSTYNTTTCSILNATAQQVYANLAVNVSKMFWVFVNSSIVTSRQSFAIRFLFNSLEAS